MMKVFAVLNISALVAVFLVDRYLAGAGLGTQNKLKNAYVWSKASKSQIIKKMGHFQIDCERETNCSSDIASAGISQTDWRLLMRNNGFEIVDVSNGCDNMKREMRILISDITCLTANRKVGVETKFIGARKCWRNYKVRSLFEKGRLVKNRTYKETISGCHY